MTDLPRTPAMDLTGKRALVTGASSGIGLGCAVALAEAGAHVVCAARRPDVLGEAVSAMQAEGWRAEALPLDQTDLPALKAAFDAGEIGKGELLAVTSFDPAPPPLTYVKVSGGIFRDMTIHDFDICQWLMGGLPETVTAKGSSIVDPEIGAEGDFDTAVITLTYDDGRIATIRNSRRAAFGYDQRIELLGSEGMLQAENMPENLVRKSTADGVTGAKPMLFFLERYMPAYAAEWDAFVSALKDSTPMPATLEEGVAALEVADAATESAKTGQTVRL